MHISEFGANVVRKSENTSPPYLGEITLPPPDGYRDPSLKVKGRGVGIN
jgi:hypothetical protein